MSEKNRSSVADQVAEHRCQVDEADRKWRKQGRAESGGSAEGWGLEGEVRR